MNRNLFLPVLVVAMIVVSCGRPDKNAIAIPKDAATVFHINGAALSSKISWNEIKNSIWFKSSHTAIGVQEDSIGKNFLEAIDSSGVNTNSDMFFFSKYQGTGQYGAFEGTLTNAAAFEAFNKKLNPKAARTKDGDINILKDENVVVTWTDTRFIYLFDIGHIGFPGNMRNFPGAMTAHSNFPADSLVKFSKQLYDPGNSDNLLSDKRFASLIKENGDMHFWSNAEYGLGRLGGLLSMLKADVLFEGHITTGAINFDNGKILMQTKSYYNDQMAKIYEKYPMKNFDESILKRIPSQNVSGVLAMNFPFEGLQPLLKVIGMDGWLNGITGKMGFTMEEVVKALKGDVLVALSDLETQKGPDPTADVQLEGGRGNPFEHLKYNLLFATSIKDKPAFEKIWGITKNSLGIPEDGGGKFRFAMNDNWFAVSNSQEHANAFLAGGNNNLPFIDKIKGYPAFFYLDLQKVMKPFAIDSTQNTILQASLNMWENVVATGGNITDGAFNAHVEINLVDKKTNSLKQLNQYFDRLSMARNRVAF